MTMMKLLTILSGLVLTLGAADVALAGEAGKIKFENNTRLRVAVKCHGGSDNLKSGTLYEDKSLECGNTEYMEVKPDCHGACGNAIQIHFADRHKSRTCSGVPDETFHGYLRGGFGCLEYALVCSK